MGERGRDGGKIWVVVVEQEGGGGGVSRESVKGNGRRVGKEEYNSEESEQKCVRREESE